MKVIEHLARLTFEQAEEYVKDHGPSGSGIDAGTKLVKKTDHVMKFEFGYHHMNEGGMYDGWTEHTLTVKPSFIWLDMRITGRDRNQIKDYLCDVYDYWLNSELTK